MFNTKLSRTTSISRVAAAASSTTLLAENLQRRVVIIHNDSVAYLYVKFGDTASSTSYTYKLAPDQTLETHATVGYCGIITGIWSAASGSAQITEI